MSEFKYGVEELAKELGIQKASARIALRSRGVPKNGKSYGWNSQDEIKKVVNTLRADKPAQKLAKPAQKSATKKKAVVKAKPVKKQPAPEANA